MKLNERRIRELAYQIWEAEGRPEGQHERHWRMARSLAESEAANTGGHEEPVKPRFEGEEEPEKPAILQEPPRRKGSLPEADPEVPAESATPAPRAPRKPAAKTDSPAKASSPAQDEPSGKPRKPPAASTTTDAKTPKISKPRARPATPEKHKAPKDV
ncbi:DUF2934 domain-containing protein [Pseudomonas sp. PDNC002]|uniref:DUF2934 domain-containing protein n=1 Tax=Pseudomonas sp. PDNC002 TaxID=2811422 RepID=UPI0019658D54|nr:DUF2934 domain-containing protein [Pseudomonas sp. PDNC002]QRY77866.1 DUF2934 domain-containing protein [Pseudomonas sp. PDNC002]